MLMKMTNTKGWLKKRYAAQSSSTAPNTGSSHSRPLHKRISILPSLNIPDGLAHLVTVAHPAWDGS